MNREDDLRDRVARRVVVLASTPYRGHQLYDQRLARALRARGTDVVYVEPPVPVGVRRRWHENVSATLAWTSEDGMAVISPRMLPLGRRAALVVLTNLLVAVQVRVLLGRGTWRGRRGRGVHGGRPGPGPGVPEGVVCIGAHPTLVRAFRRHPRVLLLKDDYVAGASLTGQNPRPVRRRRRALLRLHEQVAVVSPVLAETVLHEGAAAVVVPAGCEPVPPGTDEPASVATLPRPRAVFVGMLSDRIDFDLLHDTVAAGFHLVLAGRRQFRFSEQEKYERLRASGQVSELGDLSPLELASVMTSCDVGLVPYTLSPFNLASFPLKTLEYLAAGLPVVSTPLPSVLWLDEPHIHVARSRADAPSVLARALEEARDPAVAVACRAAAAEHSWDRRAGVFLELLAEAGSR